VCRSVKHKLYTYYHLQGAAKKSSFLVFTVEKTAKKFRGLLYFAAPCITNSLIDTTLAKHGINLYSEIKLDLLAYSP